MQHQVRAVPGAVIGFDMVAAFALAEALGLEPLVVADLLPEIEAAAVPAMNERIRSEQT